MVCFKGRFKSSKTRNATDRLREVTPENWSSDRKRPFFHSFLERSEVEQELFTTKNVVCALVSDKFREIIERSLIIQGFVRD